jgi:CRISPR-associated protein Cas5d
MLSASNNDLNPAMPSSIRLHISGDFACFTRPEMKVERVSYDVITPSAARGILEAIYWKPQFRWVIDRIHVLKPIRFTNIRRNEVGSKANSPTAAAMNGETVQIMGLVIDEVNDEGKLKNRQQRATTLLRDVAYIIEARLEILDLRMDRGGEEKPASHIAGKHLDMFRRRAKTGQCFHQPCLGNREFPARFTLMEPDAPVPPAELPPEQLNKELGWMLHDIAYLPADKNAKDSFLTGQGKRVRTEPRFFNAKLVNGVIEVPPFQTATA